MKNFIICILFYICGIYSSSLTAQQYSNFELRTKNGLWYKQGEDTPYTGLYMTKWREAEYLDGEPVWEKRYDAPAGRKQLHFHTKAWAKNSEGKSYVSDYIEYNSREGIQRKIEYNGAAGLETSYYQKGQIHYTKQLSEGVQHGQYKEYYIDGKIKEESNWENGKLKGYLSTYEYYKDGQLLEKISHNGSLYLPSSAGKSKRYSPDGNIITENEWSPDGSYSREYTDNGKLLSENIAPGRPNVNDTIRRYFPESGIIREEIIHGNNGREVIRKSFYSNGNKRTDYNYGEEKIYYFDGRLMSEIQYETEHDNIAHEKAYYENGQLMIERNSVNYLLEGTQIRYHDNGTIQAKMNFRDGKLIGKSIKTYHSNGSPQSIIQYGDSGKVEHGKIFYPDKKVFVERKKPGNNGKTTVNIHIYNENKIFADHDHYDNTLLLPYILLGDKEDIHSFYLNYIETGKPYPEQEEGMPEDCGCGPEPSDTENFEYLYENNRFSGYIKCYYPDNNPVLEITYKDGLKHGKYVQRDDAGNIINETTYNRGEIIDESENNAE